MNRIFVLMGVLLLTTACVKKVDGTLDAKKDLLLNTKKGQRQITAGTHPAKLKLKKKKKVTLEVDQNGEKIKVVFKVPKGTRIPRNYGSLRLSSAEVAQPYDVAANIDNNYSSSEPRHGTESCYRTVYRPVQRCEMVTVGEETRCRRVRQSDGSFRRVCERVPVQRRRCRTVTVSESRRGYRNISYRITGNAKAFTFALKNPATQENVATFKGFEYSSGREILSRGRCRVRGYHIDTGRWIVVN